MSVIFKEYFEIINQIYALLLYGGLNVFYMNQNILSQESLVVRGMLSCTRTFVYILFAYECVKHWNCVITTHINAHIINMNALYRFCNYYIIELHYKWDFIFIICIESWYNTWKIICIVNICDWYNFRNDVLYISFGLFNHI